MKLLNLVYLFSSLAICSPIFAASAGIAEKARYCGVERFDESKLTFQTLKEIVKANEEDMYISYSVTLKLSKESSTANDLGLSRLNHIGGDVYTGQASFCGLLEASGKKSVQYISI